MSDRRPATLLEFAIAASVAIVPLLVVVLLAVSWLRPSDPASDSRQADRHVSVRQVAALKTFEHAIARRDKVKAGPPSAAALLEGVPRCSGEWSARGSGLGELRRRLFPAGPARPAPAERIASHLQELDEALARFSSTANRRVSEPVGFDSLRWFEAVTGVLQTPVQTTDYSGRTFAVQCADVAAAVATIARSNGRMLAALAWRGTEVERTIANWRPDQFVEISARHVARSNPWRGIPGCVYLGSDGDGLATHYVAGARGVNDELCRRPEMLGASDASGGARPPVRLFGEPEPDMAVGDPRWKVPPSLQVMLQALETLQRPSGALYRLYTDGHANSGAGPMGYRYGPNRLDVRGTPVDVGFSVDVTVDPGLQAIAQMTAACYTGRQDVCASLGIRRREDAGKPIGHRMIERAVVRMAAIAVIDVDSGRIEALAGALSPCTRQEYDGPGRSTRCDKRLPYPIRYRPDALLNAAVYHDAMPASLIKPIMAAAFLSDPGAGARWLAAERAELRRDAAPAADSLRGQLMRSSSARFLDRMFCADQRFGPCERPWQVQAAALAFGWNGGCTDAHPDCGKRDVLFGRGVDVRGEAGLVQPLSTLVAYGRLLTEPQSARLGSPFRLRAAVPLDGARVRACAAGADGVRPSDDDWEKCRGAIVVDLVAEGWGQGHARSTALGAAGMMASLAAAANGDAQVRRPHLVRALRGVGPASSARLESAVIRWSLAEPEANPLSREIAEVILSGLSYSHRAGTARRACEQVFDERTCQDMRWIAGKTGTPTFPNDERSLDELARLCGGRGAGKPAKNGDACGPLRPYKWYVAAYRSERDGTRWSKAIGVLTERNWLADGGRIHGAGDRGPNPAAEIALHVAGRHAGVLASDGK